MLAGVASSVRLMMKLVALLGVPSQSKTISGPVAAPRGTVTTMDSLAKLTTGRPAR